MSRVVSPSEMLEDLTARAVAQVRLLSPSGFRRALNELMDVHKFLMDAYTTPSADGTPMSLAELGFWHGHRSWVSEYRDLFDATIPAIEHQARLVETLFHAVPARLLPGDARKSDPVVTASLLDIPLHLVHELADWADSKRLPDPMIGLPESPVALRQPYKRVVGTFTSAWEGILDRVPSMYGWNERDLAPEELWRRYSAAWIFLGRHLLNTANLLAVAVRRNDKTAVDIYMDGLGRWMQRFGFQFDRNIAGPGMMLLSPTLVGDDWPTVAARTKALLGVDYSPSPVFGVILRNAWRDMQVLVAGVTLGWPMRDPDAFVDIGGVAPDRLITGWVDEDAGSMFDSVEMRFEDLLASMIRMETSGVRWGNESYGTRLDYAVDQLDGVGDPLMRSNRVYSGRRFSREDVVLPILAMLASRAWPGLSASSRVLDLLGREDVFSRGDADLRRLLRSFHDWRRYLSDPDAGISRGVTLLGVSPDEVPTRIAELGSLLDQFIAKLTTDRSTRLDDSQVSDRKLRELGVQIEQELLKLDLAPFELRVIQTEGVPGPTLEEFSFTGVGKGTLTDPPMEDPSDNFGEFVANGVARHAARLVWWWFGQRDHQSIWVPEPTDFWRTVKATAAPLLGAGRRPILLVNQDSKFPLVRRLLNSETSDDVHSVRDRNRNGHWYICTADGIEVYSFFAKPDEAWLFPADILAEVIQPPLSSGIRADVTFEERKGGTLVVNFALSAVWRSEQARVFRLGEAPPAGDEAIASGPPEPGAS